MQSRVVTIQSIGDVLIRSQIDIKDPDPRYYVHHLSLLSYAKQDSVYLVYWQCSDPDPDRR